MYFDVIVIENSAYKGIMRLLLNLIYKVQFFLSVCLSVCFNSSETAIVTSIKLGTIDHHGVISVIKGFATSSDVIINFFFNLHYLTEENRFLLKTTPASDLPHNKNFHLFGI